MDGFRRADNRSYGQLLGEYFRVVSTIGAMETKFDYPELDCNETYRRLVESRRELRALLDEASQPYRRSNIEDVLDEAFSSR